MWPRHHMHGKVQQGRLLLEALLNGGNVDVGT
jgi:hypothetical protein